MRSLRRSEQMGTIAGFETRVSRGPSNCRVLPGSRSHKLDSGAVEDDRPSDYLEYRGTMPRATQHKIRNKQRKRRTIRCAEDPSQWTFRWWFDHAESATTNEVTQTAPNGGSCDSPSVVEGR